jgi:type I restriction enzyme R subunit
MSLNESIVEDAALEWFGELGYAVGHGPHLAPGEPAAERDSFGEVVLVGRLREAIRRLNPAVPEEAREEALRKVLRVATTSLVQTNRAFHRMLRDGVPVEYARPDGSIAGDHVRLLDFFDVRSNDWLVVNQFTVIEGQSNRRPDIVVFVNGLPLGLVELKNAADEGATVWSAYAQFQTYKAEIPSLLHYNALLVVSDGLQARIGSLTANQEWFKVWRTIDGHVDAAPGTLELETLIRGVFDPIRFLDLLQHFIVFEEDPDSGAVHKIIAGYHQFHAVNAAVEETVRASGMNEQGSTREDPGTYWAGKMLGGQPGDRRAGVVWHTQGSGKSFSMLFYAARVVRHPAMQNPTIVVLTDRNDLDDQLFGQFKRCHEILGQMPVQAESRDHLRELLAVASGGVIFTTIQKFMPSAPSPQPSPTGRGSEHYRGGYDFSGLMQKARELRQEQTPAEEMLWQVLRNRQLGGLKFRRQHQFGDYVCDLYCAEEKLVVECDGGVHETSERRKIDQKRDAYLESQGLTVLRFPNERVLNETDAVLSEIMDSLPSTSGRGAGGISVNLIILT